VHVLQCYQKAAHVQLMQFGVTLQARSRCCTSRCCCSASSSGRSSTSWRRTPAAQPTAWTPCIWASPSCITSCWMSAAPTQASGQRKLSQFSCVHHTSCRSCCGRHHIACSSPPCEDTFSRLSHSGTLAGCARGMLCPHRLDRRMRCRCLCAHPTACRMIHAEHEGESEGRTANS